MLNKKTNEYIDEKGRDTFVVYGFIAQQVKEVIPKAVETTTETIPNIDNRVICNNKISNFDDDVINELNLGDKIKIFDENGNEDFYKIIDINLNVIQIDKKYILINLLYMVKK